jgi:hypothetical protein
MSPTVRRSPAGSTTDHGAEVAPTPHLRLSIGARTAAQGDLTGLELISHSDDPELAAVGLTEVVSELCINLDCLHTPTRDVIAHRSTH